MPYPFGKQFSYEFYVLQNNTKISLATIAAPEGIYVYTARPARSDAVTGGGSPLQSVSEWSASSDGLGKAITIDAIDDPAPTSEISRYNYFIAINFKFADGEQTQTVIRELIMQRVESQQETVSTDGTTLSSVFPTIDDYFTSGQQTAGITNAVEKLKLDLSAMGYQWAGVWRPDDLKIAVAYRALAELMLSLMKDSTDEWSVRHDHYKQTYSAIISSIKLSYDGDSDGEKDKETHRAGGVLRVSR